MIRHTSATRRGRAATTAVAVLMALTALAACSSSAKPVSIGTCLAPVEALGSPSATEFGATATTSSSAPAALPSGTGIYASDRVVTLPDTHLACLDGSGNVRLTGIHAPTLISLWGSWCAPCRAELPVIESFATSAQNRVAVVGVDTADERSAGRALVSDFGLTFPQVEDRDSTLLTDTSTPNDIPMLLFVRDGKVVLRYADNKLDSATLDHLVTEYLGVAIGSAGP